MRVHLNQILMYTYYEADQSLIITPSQSTVIDPKEGKDINIPLLYSCEKLDEKRN